MSTLRLEPDGITSTSAAIILTRKIRPTSSLTFPEEPPSGQNWPDPHHRHWQADSDLELVLLGPHHIAPKRLVPTQPTLAALYYLAHPKYYQVFFDLSWIHSLPWHVSVLRLRYRHEALR